MSYRNPKIIDDKSGMVLGQAIAAGAKNISKGIIGMVEKDRIAKEKKDKEDKEKIASDKLKSDKSAAVIIKSAADRGAWAKNVAKNMKGLSESTTQLMYTYINEGAAIAQEGIDGAYGPEHLKKVAKNASDKEQLNQSAAGWITMGGVGQEYLGLTTHQRRTMVAFPSVSTSSTIDGKYELDNGAAIEDAMFAGTGLIGYSYSQVKNGAGDVMQKIEAPDGTTSFMTTQSWNAIKDNPMYVRKTNTTQNMEAHVKGGLMIKNTITEKMEVKTGFKQGNPIPLEVNGYNVSRQPFNTGAVQGLMDGTAESVWTNIEAVGDTPHGQALWLKDMGLGQDYNNMAEGTGTGTKKQLQVKTIKGQPQFKEQFLNLMGIKEDGEGGYYKDTKLSKIPKKDVKEDVALNKIYKKYSEGLSAIKNIEGVDEKVQAIIELASLGEGATIARGSSKEYVGNLNLTNDYVVQFGKPITGGTTPKYANYNLKTPSGAENFLRNKTGIEDQDQLDKLVEALQAAIKSDKI